jgi:CubicO group peptidase (beta-lactamase class C family)
LVFRPSDGTALSGMIAACPDHPENRRHRYRSRTDRPAARYRSKWYIDDSNGPLLFGLGIHGQYLFVDAERQLVVAKVSSEELPLDAARITSTLRAVSAVRRALAD